MIKRLNFRVLKKKLPDNGTVESELNSPDSFVNRILQKCPHAMWISDDKGTLQVINPACCSLLNTTPSEVTGKYNLFDDHIFKEQEILSKISSVFREGKTVNFTFTYASSQSRNYEIEKASYPVLNTTIFPITDENGNITHAVVQYADITQSVMKEKALRESEEKYRTILENIEEGYYEVDLAGNFTFFNEAMCHILGYPGDKLMGMNNRQYMTPESAKRVYTAFNKVYTTGKTAKLFDYDTVNADGRTLKMEGSVSLIKDAQDQPTGFRGIVRDVTDFRKREIELQKMEKLESIGVLAGGIAHDFNNILSVMVGNIILAKMELRQEDELFKLMTEIEQACWRAQKLTKQLLTFSKGGDPVKKTASIYEIVKETAGFALRGSAARCDFDIPEDLWMVEVDPGQISQVIHNLILNADQAMPQGGIIHLSAENTILEPFTFLPLSPGPYIRLRIQDHGIGISEDHVSRIFDPYFTTKQKGSGLGLTTAFNIVKKHKGHIDVKSQLGVGTEFIIYLPGSGKTMIQKKSEEAKPVMGKGKILIMDDEESLRILAGRILIRLGYTVEYAKHGQEAIVLYQEAKASGEPFDAVIMDLTVPGGMGGKEAINKLLELDPEAKAVVTSGYSNDPVLANFRGYGFCGVIPKPFNIQDLSQVLSNITELKDK